MIKRTGLLSSDQISRDELFSFFRRLSKSSSVLPKKASKVGILAFFEPSTRTRVSFEKAGLDAGIKWIQLSADELSLKKGESLSDTFKTIALYKPDFLVVRHPAAGFAHLVSEWTGLPVFNAGDGQRDHPTQGLLDAFTLWSRNPKVRYKIAFFGDVSRSRVARSDIHFFRELGYSLSVVDDGLTETQMFCDAYKLKLIRRVDLKKMDVVVGLRIQKERGSERMLAPLQKIDLGGKTLVMHPGPVILGEDLAHELGDFSAPYSLVHEQVKSGLRVRAQLLKELVSQEGSS